MMVQDYHGGKQVNIYDYTPSAVTSWTQVGPIIGDPGQQYVANTADHIGFGFNIIRRINNSYWWNSSSGELVKFGNPRLFLNFNLTKLGPYFADGYSDEFGFAALSVWNNGGN